MPDPQDYLDEMSWTRYEKLVMDKLNTLDIRMQSLEEQQVLTRIEVAKLKVKSGLWGAAAGFVPAMLALVLTQVGGA